MRVIRYAVVVCVLVGVSGLVYAGPREPRESRVAKIVKKIRALGDLITVPIPAPKP
jgi:hypothetical protein